ncbi:MAG: ParB/RepB/Spo0J family partition protein [Lachnospiraceae bacterium]|nr:ParB/RepB/Spo0J family partition protein [Lachnospiraceae bacterium]MCM1235360.1 ParB/RepB/Spo0J family partition protein [Ruminococcus flavefaciens]
MFDLNSFLATPTAMQNAIRQIPCEMLRPYHNHRFALYTGERLDDMVASIKANGVLSPIVVQPCENGYEILIGHNRWNASQIAEIPTIPAIIKEGLSEQETEIYVIESNLIQRGFDNLKISEQASVIALRHSEMFSQGKRNDIIHELQMLENPEKITSS